MIKRLIWNSHTRRFVLWILALLPLRKGRMIYASWGGAKYNCNPRAIVEEVCHQGFETKDNRLSFYYAFNNPKELEKKLPLGVLAVEIGSLEYYYILATSKFIIFNIRMAGMFFPYKKKGQIYIQTQHGGHGIKKVEFDADLPEEYLKAAKEDTDRTDLMLSDSKYWTNVYRTSYRYSGEILEKGLPRNDIFFQEAEESVEIQNKVYKYIYDSKGVSITKDIKLLIYTPTFRSNKRRDVYGFEPDNVINALESRFGGTWYLLISSHPNMRSYYKDIYDFSHPRMIDVGMYPELQELLVVCDALITDYSSAEMDFSLTNRPIFQLCRDRKDYDRGFYINPEELPFPYAESDEELIANIRNFDNDKYLEDLEKFNKEVIGLKETGHAAEAVVEWMINRIR